MDASLRVGFGGLYGQFNRVEQRACVAIGHVDEVVQRFFIYIYFGMRIAIRELVVRGQRRAVNRFHPNFSTERLDCEKEGAIHGEIGVFSSCSDENDRYHFPPREQGILLCFVEAMDFVDK